MKTLKRTFMPTWMSLPLEENFMSPDTKNLHHRTAKIREYINDGRKHHELLQEQAKISQVCSSLDAIEDSEQAITAFTKMDFRTDVATGYLLIYGVLQAAFLQQDATTNLDEALGVAVDRAVYPALFSLREIRNDSIGHPTKRES